MASLDNKSIRAAVKLWNEDRNASDELYGKIENWDVSRVTNMDYLFYLIDISDANLENWDVSALLSFKGIFSGTVVRFDIAKWNVSNVIC